MLRGYHPLKEIYRWERVIFALCFLSFGVLELGDLVEHSDVASPGAENIAFFLVFPLTFLCIWLLFLSPVKRRLMKLFRLQRTILTGQGGSMPVALSDSAPVEVSLPVSVSTCSSRSIWRMLSFFLPFLVGCVLFLQLPFFLPDPYLIPSEILVIIPSFLGLFFLFPIDLALPITADFYLLPSLELDENGIRARYGRDSVSIAWQHLCFFALVEYKRFGNTDNFSLKPRSRREWVQIYIICDGENTIAWYADPRGKMQNPSSLSIEEYAKLLEKQLPALVGRKTGLPLLNMCRSQRAKAALVAPTLEVS
ncbi:MAG TPA: hypothetical protein VFV38_26945 [Ktedonobacteraceae bacterium]|nr:hypothetical protein [Ktedonobacteraceae bacterium]